MKDTITQEYLQNLYDLPFFELISKANAVHLENFGNHDVQISTLCSIKTGGCPENCSYCPQSAHYQTGLEKQKLMLIEDVLSAAKMAKDAGATRFCMGAAWRGPSDSQIEIVSEMVAKVKEMGLETCVTLGLLKDGQAEKLKEAGLDYYNHNIDTSEEFYDKIITTRKFQDRIDTLQKVSDAGINVCCGGILGMGEGKLDRLDMLATLANFSPQPQSVPINKLIAIPGTPLEKAEKIDSFDFVKIIAIARIIMPKSFIRLAAGRSDSSDEFQALCFFAGVNSIFYGEKLLTAENPDINHDDELLSKLGLGKMG